MQFDWIFTLGITNLLIFIAIFVIVGTIIQAIFLGIGLGFVNGKKRNLGTTFVTALMMSLVLWIPCLGCILAWYFIKSRHDVGWGGALVAWILGAIVQIIVLMAIMFLFFGAIFAAIMGGIIPTFPMP
ncbi:MAG: hypothetical protein KAU48_04425 [Candidatus Thorarchaeota archaeon]|nr:hypothetical protein [Candidatus Thorarchaeota archaeon]